MNAVTTGSVVRHINGRPLLGIVERCDTSTAMVRWDSGYRAVYPLSQLVSPASDDMGVNVTTTCPQCHRDVRVSEPYAFRGRDRLRMTLACGHVVLRSE